MYDLQNNGLLKMTMFKISNTCEYVTWAGKWRIKVVNGIKLTNQLTLKYGA